MRDVQVADVVAIRRAVDLLRTLPQVDPDRIGYVGWSAGAKTGALVAASEPRVQALVLLVRRRRAALGFYRAGADAMRAQVKRVLGSIDPLRYIDARPGTVLLEDGRKDQIVPQAALRNIVRAAPEQTTVHWYAAQHQLTNKAYGDAFDWLAQKLGIKGPSVPGAETETTR